MKEYYIHKRFSGNKSELNRCYSVQIFHRIISVSLVLWDLHSISKQPKDKYKKMLQTFIQSALIHFKNDLNSKT